MRRGGLAAALELRFVNRFRASWSREGERSVARLERALGRKRLLRKALDLPRGGLVGQRRRGVTQLDMAKPNSHSHYAIYLEVIPALIRRMRTAIDDLPHVSASRMRAAGEIGPNDTTTTVAFPAGDTFTVGLQHVRFPNRGSWSFFICACGRRCRTLRLYDGSLGCKGCLEAKGLRYRVGWLSKPERAAHVASRLKPRLTAASPARLKPHLRYSKLERRSRLEMALRRCEYIVSRHDFRDLIGKASDVSSEGSGQL
jgi:hypothetical protein